MGYSINSLKRSQVAVAVHNVGVDVVTRGYFANRCRSSVVAISTASAQIATNMSRYSRVRDRSALFTNGPVKTGRMRPYH